MKATIINANASNLNPSHRKENNFREEYAAFYVDEDDNLRELVTLRIYATDRRSYACCWITSGDAQVWTRGSGYAGGYGYHRASAAAEEALAKAGVKLSEHINGRGDSAILAAVKAVAIELVGGQYFVYAHHAHA